LAGTKAILKLAGDEIDRFAVMAVSRPTPRQVAEGHGTAKAMRQLYDVILVVFRPTGDRMLQALA
jgi:hypothetical protein